MLTQPDMEPPREETAAKLELTLGLELDESARDFVTSLDARIKSGRRLTPAQLGALHNIIHAHASQIENFEAVRAQLGMEAPPEDDGSAPALLEAMTHVKEWKEPVQRGKRTFDDRLFYESLSKHFSTRKFLSPRQRSALARMVRRYRDQVPGYDQLAAKWDLGAKTKKATK